MANKIFNVPNHLNNFSCFGQTIYPLLEVPYLLVHSRKILYQKKLQSWGVALHTKFDLCMVQFYRSGNKAAILNHAKHWSPDIDNIYQPVLQYIAHLQIAIKLESPLVKGIVARV